ncbi:MAG: GNAT family N-acetyltransferase [Bacteroides cellulosilyticus]
MTQEINSNIRIIHVINGPITETITIRPIEEKDNKEIAALIRKVFEEFDAPKTESVYSDPLTDRLFQSFYQHPRAGYWVVEYNSNIVGGCGFYPTEGLRHGLVTEIVKFYLSPLPQREESRVSALLNTVVEEKPQKDGYKQLYIESFPQFQNAVSLYERKDFRHLESRLGNSGHTATTIHMIKDI